MTLDALGTMLELEPPAPRLVAGLAERFGLRVTQEEAGDAVIAEIAYYRAHLHEGRDPEALAALRRRCAGVLRDALPPRARELDPDAMAEVLLDAIRFSAYPDAAPALRALRDRGLVLVAISNWDVSLHEQLAATGLTGLLDAAVSSAEVGAAKPDPAIFAHALGRVGIPAEAALHVGDDVVADAEGARAAGLRAVLIDRVGGAVAPSGVATIASLAELETACA